MGLNALNFARQNLSSERVFAEVEEICRSFDFLEKVDQENKNIDVIKNPVAR